MILIEFPESLAYGHLLENAARFIALRVPQPHSTRQ
jgi:hypothetical protein